MATKLREPALIPYSQVAVPATQSETPFSRTLFAFSHAFLTLFPHTQHLLTLFSLGVGFSVCLPVQSSKRSANSEPERTLTGELYLVLCLAAGTMVRVESGSRTPSWPQKEVNILIDSVTSH